MSYGWLKYLKFDHNDPTKVASEHHFGHVTKPIGIAVDPAGNVWITSMPHWDQGRVYKISYFSANHPPTDVAAALK